MLEIRGLTVRYGTTLAVDNLELDIDEGERVALLGANGAGKSSTLRAISHLVDFDGTVRFLGVDVRGRTPDQLAREGLIHLPEGRRIFSNLSVEENLLVGTIAHRRDRKSPFDIGAVFDLFPALGELKARPGWTLSGGQQQMLAIGRAVLGAPRLLMLDEPSLGLAPSVVDTVYLALREIVQHTTVLVVEQSTSTALDFADRAIVLNMGAIAMTGAAEELQGRRELVDAYLGIKAVDEGTDDHDIQSDATTQLPSVSAAKPALSAHGGESAL